MFKIILVLLIFSFSAIAADDTPQPKDYVGILSEIKADLNKMGIKVERAEVKTIQLIERTNTYVARIEVCVENKLRPLKLDFPVKFFNTTVSPSVLKDRLLKKIQMTFVVDSDRLGGRLNVEKLEGVLLQTQDAISHVEERKKLAHQAGSYFRKVRESLRVRFLIVAWKSPSIEIVADVKDCVLATVDLLDLEFDRLNAKGLASFARRLERSLDLHKTELLSLQEGLRVEEGDQKVYERKKIEERTIYLRDQIRMISFLNDLLEAVVKMDKKDTELTRTAYEESLYNDQLESLKKIQRLLMPMIGILRSKDVISGTKVNLLRNMFTAVTHELNLQRHSFGFDYTSMPTLQWEFGTELLNIENEIERANPLTKADILERSFDLTEALAIKIARAMDELKSEHSLFRLRPLFEAPAEHEAHILRLQREFLSLKSQLLEVQELRESLKVRKNK